MERATGHIIPVPDGRDIDDAEPRVMQAHERLPQVPMHARVWMVLQGPCRYQRIPAQPSFGLSLHRSVYHGGVDRLGLVVPNPMRAPENEVPDVYVAVGESGRPESLLAAVFDHLGNAAIPRSALSTSESVET